MGGVLTGHYGTVIMSLSRKCLCDESSEELVWKTWETTKTFHFCKWNIHWSQHQHL